MFPDEALYAARVAAKAGGDAGAARRFATAVFEAARSDASKGVVGMIVEIVRDLPGEEVRIFVAHVARVGGRVGEKVLLALVGIVRGAEMEGVRLPPEVVCRRVMKARAVAGGSGDTEGDDWSAVFITVRKGLVFGEGAKRADALELAEAVVARAQRSVAADMIALLDKSTSCDLASGDAVFVLRIVLVALSRAGRPVVTPDVARGLYERRVGAAVPAGTISCLDGFNSPAVVHVDVGVCFGQCPAASSIIVSAGVALLAKAGEDVCGSSSDGKRMERELSVSVFVPETCLALYRSADEEQFLTPPSRKRRRKSVPSSSVKKNSIMKRRRTSEMSVESSGRVLSSRKCRPRRGSFTGGIDIWSDAEPQSSDDEDDLVEDDDFRVRANDLVEQLMDEEEDEEDEEKGLTERRRGSKRERDSVDGSIHAMPLIDLVVSIQAFGAGVAALVGILNFATQCMDEEFWAPASLTSSRSVDILNLLLERVTEMSRMHLAFLRGMNALKKRGSEVEESGECDSAGRSIQCQVSALHKMAAVMMKTLACPELPSSRGDDSARRSDESYSSISGLSLVFPELSINSVVAGLLVIPGDDSYWTPAGVFERDPEVTAIEAMFMERLVALVRPPASHRNPASPPNVCGRPSVDADGEEEADAVDVGHFGQRQIGQDRKNVGVFDADYDEELRLYRAYLRNLAKKSEVCQERLSSNVTESEASTFLSTVSRENASTGELTQVLWQKVCPPDFSHWSEDDSAGLLRSSHVIAALLDRAAIHTAVGSETRKRRAPGEKIISSLQDSTAVAGYALRCVSVLLQNLVDSDCLGLISESGTPSLYTNSCSTSRRESSVLSFLKSVDSRLLWSLEFLPGGDRDTADLLGEKKKLVALLSWISLTTVDETVSTLSLDILLVLSEMNYMEPGEAREVVLDDLSRVHEYSGDALWAGRSRVDLLSDLVPSWMKQRREDGFASRSEDTLALKSSSIFVSVGGRKLGWYGEKYRLSSLFSGMPLPDALTEATVWIGGMIAFLKYKQCGPGGGGGNFDTMPEHLPAATRKCFAMLDAIGIEPVIDVMLDVAVSSLSLIDISKGISAHRASRSRGSPVFSCRKAISLLLSLTHAASLYRSSSFYDGGQSAGASFPKLAGYDFDRNSCVKLSHALGHAKALAARLSAWYRNPDVSVSELTDNCVQALREIGALSLSAARQSLAFAENVKTHASAGDAAPNSVNGAQQSGRQRRKKRPGFLVSAKSVADGTVKKCSLATRRAIPRLVLNGEGLASAGELLCRDLCVKSWTLESLLSKLSPAAHTLSIPDIGSGVSQWRQRLDISSDARSTLREDSSSSADDMDEFAEESEDGGRDVSDADGDGNVSKGTEGRFWAVSGDRNGSGGRDDTGDLLERDNEHETILVSFRRTE